MSIVIVLILVVVFFAFVFTVYKAAPEWYWYHITASVISMILAILFLFPTAGALKSRSEWHKLKEELEEQLAQVKRQNEILLYGDPNSGTTG